jgi:hypothetical protein
VEHDFSTAYVMFLQLVQIASDWNTGNVQLPVGQVGMTSKCLSREFMEAENKPEYKAPMAFVSDGFLNESG